MIKYLAAVLFTGSLACTSSPDSVKNGPHTVKCYSGILKIYDGESSDSPDQRYGYISFSEKDSGEARLIRANCVIKKI